MKTKIISLLVALFATFICFSCTDDDKDDSNDLTGVWNYNACHFVMEFEQEAIPLPEGMNLKAFLEMMGMKSDKLGELGELKSIPVKMLVTGFSEYANSMMTKYFKGLEFTSDYDFVINIATKEKNISLAATYAIGKDAFYTELDKESLKQIIGKNIPIPSSSRYFYTLSDNQLVLFTNKTKIETLVTILSAMPGDKNPARKAYITSILEQTKKLEFGVILKR